MKLYKVEGAGQNDFVQLSLFWCFEMQLNGVGDEIVLIDISMGWQAPSLRAPLFHTRAFGCTCSVTAAGSQNCASVPAHFFPSWTKGIWKKYVKPFTDRVLPLSGLQYMLICFLILCLGPGLWYLPSLMMPCLADLRQQLPNLWGFPAHAPWWHSLSMAQGQRLGGLKPRLTFSSSGNLSYTCPFGPSSLALLPHLPPAPRHDPHHCTCSSEAVTWTQFLGKELNRRQIIREKGNGEGRKGERDKEKSILGAKSQRREEKRRNSLKITHGWRGRKP
ncbi:hypothetical protein MC885_001095 [Smutsia gigantea]|nr:hypothetical protein MC885_001095 [Smutsia gigantea]